MSAKHGLLGSSPSSGGAETAQGTPETRLTPFSSVKSIKPSVSLGSHGEGLRLSADHVSTHRLGFDSLDKDPFISNSSHMKGEQSILSPTASAFQPYALRISQEMSHASGIALSPTFSGELYPQQSRQHSSTSPSSISGVADISTQWCTFSTDSRSVSRALKISGIVETVQVEAVQACIQKACSRSSGSLKFARCGDDILVHFSDIFDSINVHEEIRSAHPEWSVSFISPITFIEKTNPNSPRISAHEGQVCVIARFPSTETSDYPSLGEMILGLLAMEGPLYAWQKQLTTETGTLRVIAEYSDVSLAERVVERLNGATVQGVKISATFHRPDLVLSPRQQGHPSTPTRGRINHQELSDAMNCMSVTAPDTASHSVGASTYSSVLSPTGRSFLPSPFAISTTYSPLPLTFSSPFSPAASGIVGVTTPNGLCNTPYPVDTFGRGLALQHCFVSPLPSWDDPESPSRTQPLGSPLVRYNPRRQSLPRAGNRSPYNNSQVGQHNVVDIGRIRAGLDVRTTIMLRNIPNKIDQSQLKAIVDETSRGQYDFMYLRIDFANNCNVGYAFINFEDPYHIINFVAARAGQRWNRYSSDKVAEVSYATIQGKDCLVQKFRNSSVMLEHPSFRPKIFYTGSHPRAGEEEDFPLPDNASKMRRSVENAEHVGLFAPRAGQHYRDEQRRRRSRYDRGTRLAALEEYDYEDYYPAEQDIHD